MTEDNNMRRTMEVSEDDEYFVDAFAYMQPRLDDLECRLTDAIRGLAAPRAGENLIAPFDGSYAANTFFQQLDQISEAPSDNTTRHVRLRALLKGEPLSLYNELSLASRPYDQAKQILMDLYPGISGVTFTKFMTYRLNSQTALSDFYRQKVAMGLQLGLTNPIIVEARTEGLQANDQRLTRALAPQTLTDWSLFRIFVEIFANCVANLPFRSQASPLAVKMGDTISGFSKYGNKKSYLNVIVDHLSRYTWTFPIKLQILREIEVEKKKKTDVAQKHNIPQSSLSTIIKNSEKIHQQALHAGESSRKRARGSTYADVDEALLQWFKQARSAALPVNGPLLSEKAKTLALEFGLKDFTGSGGWIERWKARHGIKLRNICGESADVNRETMTNWLTDVMPNIISNYACKDIFNADETGLFWRLLPDKTLHFKGETCTGGKASKERITILLCCNMDGSEKMQPLVIGKAKQPRCFRGIKHLPVQYEANQKAWMTGLLFESWVRHIDKKMAGQHRQIILLLDNCGAHPPDMQGLTNTRIAFLPPNTTSMLQPCDQAIIRNFKMIYRTRLMRKYLTAYDAGTALTINLKQAVDIISVAWNDVLPATISNCWHHSGIIKSDVSSPLDTPQPATQMWEQQSLFDRMKEVLKIPLEMDFDSYADADNDVVTNAMLSDVEIVESILQAKEEEETDQVDEEVDPIVHIPHPKEVLESIQTLRLFLQCQDESKSLHRHLSDLDNIEKSVQHLLLTSKCQNKITNYFSKNT
ncbi:TIGD4 [Cordylochernes scorpioides]|uniref:TIGD4 n=1 Tax=Cordylochernes scorpioides TaxID=51811 RepID=A0ABY6KY20_9ARAC|nr:TIGD4 [Cordylochernes scorpioides]